ncbi:hypothetical protein INR49_004702 [Caranx melampygus]|nr:hypothetical protein INR49_004702 [Caranx melampygus]
MATCTSEMEGEQASFPCARFCTYIAVIAIFLLLGRDFYCTCKPQYFDCSLYLVLPVFIVFVYVLWTDSSFQRVCRHLCSSAFRGCAPPCSFWGSCCHHIIKAAFIGLLWVVCVLIDGDWYVCCMNDHSQQQAQLACKDLGSITAEDRVIIAELKNESRAIGTFLLFGIICVPALLALFGWRKPSSCERKHLYYKLILKEEKNVLKEILRKYAKEKLTEEIENKIRGGQWEECFDVAEELVKASAQPTCSE